MGTPVWAWNFSPPLRSFISMFNLKDKKLAVWTCAGGQTEKPINNLKKIFGNKIIGELRLIEPLTNETEEAKTKAIEWAKKISQS